MEGDGAQGIAQGDKGYEQHLVHERCAAVPGKEVHHIGDAVFKARKYEDGNTKHRDEGVAEHVLRLLPYHHARVHQDTAHEGRKEDMEGEAGDIGDKLGLLGEYGRGLDAQVGKLQAGAVEEGAQQVAQVDDGHVLEGEGILQEADGSGVEAEPEVYDSEQAKGKEQAADNGYLDAHEGRSTDADEYPCPD